MSAAQYNRMRTTRPAPSRDSGIQKLGTAAPLTVLPSGEGSVEDLFIGRENDLSALEAMVPADRGYLVNIVGPAGVGKTRLARELLQRIGAESRTIFISLVELTDPDDVDDRVAAACGVTPIGKHDIERVCKRLAHLEERVIVVLDNAEHLLDSVAEVAKQLARNSNVWVVVTGREPLGIRSEDVYRLQPLQRNDGAQLLQGLARRRGVAVSGDEALDLATALDGLPLAIELAAERTTILSPAQIQVRLRESNRVLASAHEDRHASLNIALGHSWSNLSEPEQQLCTKLALFDHALTPEMIEELWPELDVLMLGQSLVSRSWITVLDDGEVRRWQMLRALRAFVIDQTLELDRLTVRERLLEWAEKNLNQDRFWWSQRTDEGLAALQLLRERNLHQAAANVLRKLFMGGTYGFRTRTILQHALELSNHLDPVEDREALSHIAICISKLSMLYTYGESATEWAERAMAIAPEGPLRIMAIAQSARALFDESRREEATARAQEGFAELQKANVGLELRLDATGWLLDFSTLFHAAGHRELSETAMREAYRFAQGEHIAQARCASHLALLRFDLGEFAACGEDLARARRLLADAPATERAICLNSFPAMLYIARGDLEEAHLYLDETVEVAERTGNRSLHYFCDRAYADLAMAEQASARPFLEHAYYRLASIDNNTSALRETWILLTLNLIYEGAYAAARERIESLLEDAPKRLQGDPKVCEQMLRAALRFCAAKLNKDIPPPADNAFEALISAALEASSARDASILQRKLADFPLSELMIPGFFLFRFEFQVRAWLTADLARSQQSLLRIEHDGRHFSLDGTRFDFSRKAALRRMLIFLARCASERPDQAVDVHEVIRETWPDQSIAHEAGLNRAYTTVNRLRTTAGLGEHLESRDDGYLIRPTLRVEWVETLDDA